MASSSKDDDDNRPECEMCQDAAVKRCGQCKSVYYCSQTCQKEHWEQHKPVCVKGRYKKPPISADQLSSKTVRAVLLAEDSSAPEWVHVPCEYVSSQDGPAGGKVFYKYANYAMFLGGAGEYTSRRRFFPCSDYDEDLMTKDGDLMADKNDPDMALPGPYHHGTYTMYFNAKANANLPRSQILGGSEHSPVDTSGTKLNKCAQSIGTTFKWHGPILVMESDGKFLNPDPERKYVDMRRVHLQELSDFLVYEVWDF